MCNLLYNMETLTSWKEDLALQYVAGRLSPYYVPASVSSNLVICLFKCVAGLHSQEKEFD